MIRYLWKYFCRRLLIGLCKFDGIEGRSRPTHGKFPKFERLCRLVTEDLLAKKQLDFDLFKTSTPEERYIGLLQSRPDLIQRVPSNHLASYIGITPPSLSRLGARIRQNDRHIRLKQG